MIDADLIRQDPAYVRGVKVQRSALLAFPVVLLSGAFLVYLSGATWLVEAWFVVLGIDVLVFAAGQVWRTYVFARRVRQHVRAVKEHVSDGASSSESR